MKIFNLYIFDKKGQCVFDQDWCKEREIGMQKEEEFKLMFGMLLSINSFANKLSPIDGKQAFHSYTTNKYKLSYLETPTGVRFVLNTSPNAVKVQELLRLIYSQCYVELIVKNPMQKTGERIHSELFTKSLNGLIEKYQS